jgi:hypothetical protein
MGIELELIVLLAIAIAGPAIFAVFEVETPAWRKLLKWVIVCALTLVLYRVAGHWRCCFRWDWAVRHDHSFHLVSATRHTPDSRDAAPQILRNAWLGLGRLEYRPVS